MRVQRQVLTQRFAQVELSTLEAKRSAANRKALLDIVSHDLRTPLASVLLAVDMLRAQHGETPHLGRLARMADQMKKLVDDLLHASRAETIGLELDLHSCEVRDLLDAAVEAMQSQAATLGIVFEVRCNFAGGIVADRARIVQILTNLGGNALRFGRSGDVITLEAVLHNGAARFAVIDSGPGIPREELDHMFEPYRPGSIPSRSGSLGLGLFICRTLVEADDGRLGVESTVGKGSTFWFELPVQRTSGGKLLAPVRMNIA